VHGMKTANTHEAATHESDHEEVGVLSERLLSLIENVGVCIGVPSNVDAARKVNCYEASGPHTGFICVAHVNFVEQDGADTSSKHCSAISPNWCRHFCFRIHR
jgi:hypothetical protein